MSVLSNEDILRELGNNIYVYPLNLDNIRGNTINLTASEMAWSLNGKRSIVKVVNRKKVIEIPGHDTALIETRETIYVTNKIGGSYHSKVSKVSLGLDHIGTTLDPGYIGPSLIAIHNHYNESVFIDVGDSIVSIIFHYLNTESTYRNTNKAGQVQVLMSLGIKPTTDEMRFLDEEWHSNLDKLNEKMENSQQFTEVKTKRDVAEQERISRQKDSTWFQAKAILSSYVLTFAAIVAVIAIVYLVEKKYSPPESKLPVFTMFRDVGLSGLVVGIFIKIGDAIYRRKIGT